MYVRCRIYVHVSGYGTISHLSVIGSSTLNSPIIVSLLKLQYCFRFCFQAFDVYSVIIASVF